MKKRLLAIALVLMMAISLFPASAFAVDVPIYVSVGGKSFTKYDQTISVGGGTATLGISQYGAYPELTLKNVNISGFDKFELEDGSFIYAGIAFSGYTILQINLEGNNTITAPTKKAAGTYVGIFADTSVEIGNQPKDVGGKLSNASLTINNMDIGIVSLPPEENCYVTLFNMDLKINNAANTGIQCTNLTMKGCNASISSKCVGIIADSVITEKADYQLGGAYNSKSYSRSSYTSVNVSSDTVPESGGLVGVQCNRFGSENQFDVNVSYKCKGSEEVFCCGINAQLVSSNRKDSTLNVAVKLQGNESSSAVGIMTDTVSLYSTSTYGFGKINVDLELKGQHGQSMGIYATDIRSENSVTSSITGADIYDIPVCTDNLKLVENGALYASTDCGTPFFGAVLLKNYESDYNIAIHWPAGGFADAEIEGEEVKYCADEDGNPAQYFIANNKGYPFIDIDSSATAPYKDAILWAVEQGITNGFNPMEFRPSSPCTRGQAVTFLWRANGSPEPAITENPFVDVSATSPYYKAILWAVEQGITNGFDATHFKPSNPCTRAQVVTFLWRADGKPAPSSGNNPFKDVSASGSTKPYYEAILWAVEQGITNGYGGIEFRPSVTCNRGQIVTFIYRDVHEKAMNARGNLVDVRIDVMPDAVFDKVCYPEIRLSVSPDEVYAPDKKGDKWDFIPVNFTYTFEDGSCDNITMYLKCPIVNGELSVGENWVQLLTVKGTKAYLSYGLSSRNPTDKYGYLLIADAKKGGAEFVKDFVGGMQAYGDYIVATEKGRSVLSTYDITNGKYGELKENIHFVDNATVREYAVYGDYLLYWCSITAEGYRIGGIYLGDVVGGYGHRFGDYYGCESFTHDETGFTVVYRPDISGTATTTEFIPYPAK